MPEEFTQCIAHGGKTITISHGNKYFHTCKLGGHWYKGEMHVKRKIRAIRKKRRSRKRKTSRTARRRK